MSDDTYGELSDGFQFKRKSGNTFSIANDEGDELYCVTLDADRTLQSILSATLHAYHRGYGIGNACGRDGFALELRRLLGAAKEGDAF